MWILDFPLWGRVVLQVVTVASEKHNASLFREEAEVVHSSETMLATNSDIIQTTTIHITSLVETKSYNQ